MNNKTKKIIAIVVPIVLILLIVLAIVLVVVLHKNDDGNNNNPDHTEHTYVYADETETQHRVTCEECDYSELKDHEYTNDQVATCKLCHHIRTIDYPSELTTPTGVKLTVDKTDLNAGDTFTLTIEIASTRKDMFWDSIDVAFGPIDENGKKPSTDISPYFEFVSKTTNIDEYIGVTGEAGLALIEDNSHDNFQDVESETLTDLGFRVSLGFIGVSIPTSKSIVITATIKVKDNASDVPTFAFGVAPLKGNIVCCSDEEDSVLIKDQFDQATVTINHKDGGQTKEKDANCITCNTIIMSIKAKEN